MRDSVGVEVARITGEDGQVGILRRWWCVLGECATVLGEDLAGEQRGRRGGWVGAVFASALGVAELWGRGYIAR